MDEWKEFAKAMPLRVGAKLLAPFVVPFLSRVQRQAHPIWGCTGTMDLSWWNIAIRNGAHNCFLMHSVPYLYEGDKDMEEPGFKWRKCTSLGGKYASFRITWGKARPKKGKREFYIGWTLSQRLMRPVMQLRVF